MNPKQILCGLTAALTLAAPVRAAALSDLSPWAQEAVLAAEAGLEPPALADAPAAEPVTRAEFCSIALSLYESLAGCLLDRTDAVWFTDCADPTVNTAYEHGIVAGAGDGTFSPGATISRQDLCVMLANVLNAAGADLGGNLSMLSDYTDGESVSPYARPSVAAMLENDILRGANGQLSPKGMASREQALIMSYRLFTDYRLYFDDADAYGAIVIPAFAELPDEQPPAQTPPVQAEEPEDEEEDSRPAAPEDESDALTEEDKLALVYGEDGAPYEDEEIARAHQTTVEVPVWRLTEDGEKIASTASLTVHEALADVVAQIFTEIFEGDEQFPIANVGGFAWRSSTRSEHRQGTAIDINWESNMEATVEEDGSLTPTSGDHWTPGEDPLSIPADGDVVRAFKRHGFAWGGDEWTSKVDYMHFSYFGH